MNNVITMKPARALDYSASQLDLIRRTVANDCNTSEFDLFVEVCRRVGLDPFRKQIYAIVYSKDTPNKRKMSIITGIDGFRAVAARNRDYRPDDEEATFSTDDTLKATDNPLGILKCTVKAYKLAPDGQWFKVSGTAYWNEFAPIVETGDFEWVDTGEKWADSGKPKKKKVTTGEVKREPAGNWKTMPHVMLAKCAEAQALRKGWPEDLSGIYSPEEMAQADAIDQSATETVEAFQSELRMKAINASNAITMDLQDGESGLQPIPVGEFADKVLARARSFQTVGELQFFKDYNRTALQEFWALQKGDALALKTELESIEAKLAAAE